MTYAISEMKTMLVFTATNVVSAYVFIWNPQVPIIYIL